MTRVSFLSAILTFAVALFSGQAIAENPNWPDGIADDADLTDPANMPDDPGYFSINADRTEAGGQWYLWSFFPEPWLNTGEPVREEEAEHLGTGIHADRAWLLSAGRPDVILGLTDCGANWDQPDLVNQYYLNAGELDREGARPCVPETFAGDPLDVDGSGTFDMADYAAYAVECAFDLDGEGNENGLIDPQDLILNPIYSDGVDDDENGYIDDISGWDFMWNDNDPEDETDFGHGDDEARWAAADGNNGIGRIGACPRCTMLMNRVGDSFLADSNDFADAVAFSVDSGASVIQCSLGTLNQTRFSLQAMEYAYENNVVVIASSADELSFHHNFPGTANHTVYVSAIVHETGSRSRSTSFLNFDSCTNYGGNLILSTSGASCSSQATGVSAGHAGLIYSYALDLGVDPELTAEEVRGLMIMAVDDIAIPESQPDHAEYDDTKYPSAEGWDLYFGYGRNNARKSLELLRDEAIPPEVDIVDPYWFETIWPSNDVTTVDVIGRVGARPDGLPPRYSSYDFVLDIAPGVDPSADSFTEVTSGTTTSIDGVIGTVDLSSLDYTGVPRTPHHFAQTLRLRACVSGSGDFGAGGTCSELRKTFFVHQDPDLFAGFPIHLESSAEPSPTFFDLDDDGVDELIVATSGGFVHAFEADGSEITGWPVQLQARKGHRDNLPNDHQTACSYRPADDRGDCGTSGHIDYDVPHTIIMGSPAVANLEGDEGGAAEVVVSSVDGFVYAFRANGDLVNGFPVSTDPALSAHTDEDNTLDEGILAAVAVYDLDGDDDLEIVAGANDQHVYVWHHTGDPMAGWPVHCRDFARDDDPDFPDGSSGNRIIVSPAVGDLDNDGQPEVLVGTNEVYADVESRYYIIHWDGNLHDGGPFEWADADADSPGPGRNFGLTGEVIPYVGRGIPTAATLADIDLDGYIEFAIEGIGGWPVMRRWDGNEVIDLWFMDISTEAFGPLTDVTDNYSYTLIDHGAFGYMDDSGDIAFLKGGAGMDFLAAFLGGGTRSTFVHQMAGWNAITGTPLEGFPRVMEDWPFFTTPTIVDLDDDGYPEVISGSGGYLVRAFNYLGEELDGWPKHTGGWLIASTTVGDFDGDGTYDVAAATRLGDIFVWHTEGSVEGRLEWNGYGHDTMNTSNYETGFPGRDRYRPDPDPDEAVEIAEAAEPVLDSGVDLGEPDPTPSGPSSAPSDEDGDSGCCAVVEAPTRSAVFFCIALVAGLFVRRRHR